jgi:hypothetical protein
MGDSACFQAKASIREQCLEIVEVRADLLSAAKRIYVIAWEAGAWEDDSPCEELGAVGAEFLQLADHLEEHQNDIELRTGFQALTKKAAEAYLSDQPFPDWPEWRNGRWNFEPPTL